MLDKKELRCATEGCGHKLEFHMIEPKVRCRVTMCRCDKWRAYPDPEPTEPALPKDWQERAEEALKQGLSVIMSPLPQPMLRLEMMRTGLGIGEPAFLLIATAIEDPDAG